MVAAIDLRRLRHVIEVARAESFTTAAQTLALTQPALTRSIGEVESALGTRLFRRHSRGVELTEGGQRFVERARRIVNDAEDLVSEARASGGRVRLGVSPAGYTAMAVRSLTAAAAAHPDLKLEIVTGSHQTLCPQLVRGELDLVLGSSSYLRRWRELQITRLRPLYFACMFRRDHPLANRRQVEEIDVLRHPVILPASVDVVYTDIAQRYAHHGLPPPRPHYSTDDATLAFELLRVSDAYYPIQHANPAYGSLAEEFLLITDAVELPPQHLSLAVAGGHSLDGPACQVQNTLLQRLGGRSADAHV